MNCSLLTVLVVITLTGLASVQSYKIKSKKTSDEWSPSSPFLEKPYVNLIFLDSLYDPQFGVARGRKYKIVKQKGKNKTKQTVVTESEENEEEQSDVEEEDEEQDNLEEEDDFENYIEPNHVNDDENEQENDVEDESPEDDDARLLPNALAQQRQKSGGPNSDYHGGDAPLPRGQNHGAPEQGPGYGYGYGYEPMGGNYRPEHPPQEKLFRGYELFSIFDNGPLTYNIMNPTYNREGRSRSSDRESPSTYKPKDVVNPLPMILHRKYRNYGFLSVPRRHKSFVTRDNRHYRHNYNFDDVFLFNSIRNPLPQYYH